MSEHKVQPTALRILAGELEDMSVWKDAISIGVVRERLEPAIAEVERRIAAQSDRIAWLAEENSKLVDNLQVFAGIPDPAAAIKLARELLISIADGVMSHRVPDSIREQCRLALRALGGGA